MQYRVGVKISIILASAVVLASALAVAFAAYKTHQESDSEQFFKAYPNVVGTRLDGCDVCHARLQGIPPGQKGGRPVLLSACVSCHNRTDYGRQAGDTLTPFGRDYLKNGRNAAAFDAIAKLDSDGDGATNAKELEAHTNPGDAASMPGKAAAPSVILSYDELIRKKVRIYDEDLFMNVTKSKDGDSYSKMRGFKLLDVLQAAGIAKSATSVDVISLDGFIATFSIDQLRRSYPQPAPVLGLGKDTLGDCGWVRYEIDNLKEGVPLPPADILLSFEENGRAYQPAQINEQQRLVGSGPFRIVAPQMLQPGVPDMSSKATEACIQKVPENYRYHRDYEKNSDYCVKAVVAIRVNPLPSGAIDIDWPQLAGKAINGKSIVIFGALKKR
jgi:hypothetical protein